MAISNPHVGIDYRWAKGQRYFIALLSAMYAAALRICW